MNIPLSETQFICAYQNSRDTFMTPFEMEMIEKEYKERYLTHQEDYHKNKSWIIEYMK